VAGLRYQARMLGMGKTQVIALVLLALAIPAIALAGTLRCAYPVDITVMGDSTGITFNCPTDSLPHDAALIMLGF